MYKDDVVKAYGSKIKCNLFLKKLIYSIMLMKIEKLQLSKQKTDFNLKFYFFLKYLVKINATNRQVILMLENINLLKNNQEALIEEFKTLFIKSESKLDSIKEIVLRIENLGDASLLEFSLRLYQIKDLLLWLRQKYLLVGTEGFEPTHGGIKTRCLTTWLRPNKWRQKRANKIRRRMILHFLLAKSSLIYFCCN